MQINVSQQLKSPLGTMRTYEVNETIDIDGSSIRAQGKVKLTRTKQGILAEGSLCAESEFTCSRCLRLFGCPLTLNIEEEYYPTTDVVTGNAVSLPDEPDCFTIDEHHILDLTEAIRQYALLAVPMKPLCSEDCAGLCPGCGHNLNEGTCDCPPQADIRWHELSKLANKQKGIR
ncbi:MAG: DUF177 domain-containing protein [Dehalococcoidales bacterium]|nr:DUF177 domain-containing protein [Dehalococcoidales bacterium]